MTMHIDKISLGKGLKPSEIELKQMMVVSTIIQSTQNSISKGEWRSVDM